MTLSRSPGTIPTTLRTTRFVPATTLLLLFVGFAAAGYTPPPLFRRDVNPQEAGTCKDCHLDITTQWTRSSHAGSDRSKNLLFGRMYLQSLRVTRGATFLNCGPCHEPISFVNQDFDFIRQVSTEGVTCVYCHSVQSAGDPRGNPPFTLDLAKYYGSIRNPVPTKSHGSGYSTFLTSSRFCGGCHEYKNQNGVTISTTYAEWKASRYPKLGITCQKCHMPGGPGHNSYLGPARPRVADHSFQHDTWAPPKSGPPVTMALRAVRSRSGDSLRVSATITNAGWGHSLPTGNDQNIVLVRIRVLTGNGAIVWENDPFTDWTNSVFGVLLADELGNWPAETWTATSIVANRRIKSGGTGTARYEVPVGDHKGPYKIQAQLLFRRSRPGTEDAYTLPDDVYGTERQLAEAKTQVP